SGRGRVPTRRNRRPARVPNPHPGHPSSAYPAPLRLAGVSNRLSRRRRTSVRSEEHTSELQSRENLVCRLLLEKKKKKKKTLEQQESRATKHQIEETQTATQHQIGQQEKEQRRARRY